MTVLSRSWPWFVGLAIWVVVLCYFSSQSELPEVGPDVPNFDKVLHAGYYFGGGILLGYALLNRKGAKSTSWWSHVLFVTLFFALIGIADEFHQSFTEGRFGNDPGDVAADVVGGFLGALLTYITHPWIFKFLAGSSAKG